MDGGEGDLFENGDDNDDREGDKLVTIPLLALEAPKLVGLFCLPLIGCAGQESDSKGEDGGSSVHLLEMPRKHGLAAEPQQPVVKKPRLLFPGLDQLVAAVAASSVLGSSASSVWVVSCFPSDFHAVSE